MSTETFGLSRGSRITIASIVGAALILGAFVLGSNGNAAEVAVKAKKTEILGAIGDFPDARCPEECSALAIVTGFQSEIDDIGSAYRVPFNGKITKWKIGLGKPTKSDRGFFERRFGSKPKAGLAILKPVTVKGKKRFKLMKRSPVLGLNRYLGKVSSITLDKPIPVKRGYYVALTVPTWAPALAADFKMENGQIVRENGAPVPAPGNEWRASRTKNKCGTPNMNNSQPQTKPGSRVEYGCRFDGQLLYRVKVTNR